MNIKEQTLATTFEKFIDGHGFPNFKGSEFTWYWDSKRGGIKNTVPPQELWGNIIPTLHVLQFLRSKLKEPIFMHSTYRSPEYNKAIDGATMSQHTVFKAIDFTVRNYSPKQIHATLVRAREQGLFRGGLGLYQTFVHIDTRGKNADWTGSGV